MKYKMIAVDMDGTLLNSQYKISPRTEAALKKAVESGIIYVTSTGRAMKGVEFVNDLFEKDLPFIIYNGASVVMGKSRKTLFNKFLDFKLASEVFDIGKSRDIPMVILTDKTLLTSSESQAVANYNKYYGMDIHMIDSMVELEGENIYKIFWTDDPEKISGYQDEMLAHFAGSLNCHTSQPIYLEFVSKDAGKGGALKELGKIYGIDRSEIIAVGDGYNDISMLEYAGLGAAMANAPDEIKAFCQHITASNDEDGVAILIEDFLLK